ncbi:hypothetical protein MUTS16_70600 [Escherichia coli]|nr:hypothetical protein MUTS16_70600 [Escherichia coli]
MGRFQDGFRNGKKNIVSYYGNLLRVYLSSPVWSLVNYSLRHSQLESVSGFIAYRQKQMHTLKEIIAKPRLTGREFHDVRKIISQQVSYYDTLRSLDPENKEALQISRFLAAINGLMGINTTTWWRMIWKTASRMMHRWRWIAIFASA